MECLKLVEVSNREPAIDSWSDGAFDVVEL
jgi:hypothetical protein